MTDHTTCCCAETIDDLRALKAAYESAMHDRNELAGRLNQSLTNYLALRSAYWSANCDRDELANALAAAIAERDRARAVAIRLEAEAAQPYLPAQMPEAVPREDQEGTESGPSRAADGLAGSDRHSGTPATEEARKSAESDAPFFAPEIGGAW